MKEFKYDVIRLVQCIKDRPCLWDKTIENYKDRIERRAAWEEIFDILDETYENMSSEQKRLTGETIINKWTNIRDTFVKSLKSKMGRPKRKYIYYEHLKFLTKLMSEESSIGQIEFMDESNEVSFMKQEDESCEEPNLTKRSKRSQFDDTPSDFCVIEPSNSHKKKSKRIDFDDLATTTNYRIGEYNSRKKSKRVSSVELMDSNDSSSKKKSKREGSFKDDENTTDVDFEEINDIDNPRLMNEDEAFFASLLPTIVKYSEDERLEFRIEVLGVMKKIKDERKWSEII